MNAQSTGPVAPDAAKTSGREFSLTRIFDASLDLVWKAWTEAEHIGQWLGPNGAALRVGKMDFRPGGSFHYCMLTPDGHEMWGKWVFREITAPKRLVLINSFSDAEGNLTRHPLSQTWPLEMLMTSTLAERDGKTALTITWIPYEATETERETFDNAMDGMKQGWTGSFDQLETYLAKFKTQSRVAYPSDREMVFTRVFDAPRELVWKAWTDPKHAALWWGPKGFRNTIHEMDVRPGGVWHLTMHGPDGTDYPNLIKYIEVVQPTRLVYDHGEPGKPQFFHVTTDFLDEGGKTKIVNKMIFATAEECAEIKKFAVEGHHQTWDRLAEHLAGRQGS